MEVLQPGRGGLMSGAYTSSYPSFSRFVDLDDDGVVAEVAVGFGAYSSGFGMVRIMFLSPWGYVNKYTEVKDGIGLPVGLLETGSEFGASLDFADIDGDGRMGELVVGAPGMERDGMPLMGTCVLLWIGEDGEVLSHKVVEGLTSPNAVFWNDFGSSMQVLDLDGDGVEREIATVVRHSSASKMVIVTLNADGTVGGEDVLNLGYDGFDVGTINDHIFIHPFVDLDGDGVKREFFLGIPDSGSNGVGYWLFLDATGYVTHYQKFDEGHGGLPDLPFPIGAYKYGETMSSLTDLDGDGVANDGYIPLDQQDKVFKVSFNGSGYLTHIELLDEEIYDPYFLSPWGDINNDGFALEIMGDHIGGLIITLAPILTVSCDGQEWNQGGRLRPGNLVVSFCIVNEAFWNELGAVAAATPSTSYVNVTFEACVLDDPGDFDFSTLDATVTFSAEHRSNVTGNGVLSGLRSGSVVHVALDVVTGDDFLADSVFNGDWVSVQHVVGSGFLAGTAVNLFVNVTDMVRIHQSAQGAFSGFTGVLVSDERTSPSFPLIEAPDAFAFANLTVEKHTKLPSVSGAAAFRGAVFLCTNVGSLRLSQTSGAGAFQDASIETSPGSLLNGIVTVSIDSVSGDESFRGLSVQIYHRIDLEIQDVSGTDAFRDASFDSGDLEVIISQVSGADAFRGLAVVGSGSESVIVSVSGERAFMDAVIEGDLDIQSLIVESSAVDSFRGLRATLPEDERLSGATPQILAEGSFRDSELSFLRIFISKIGGAQAFSGATFSFVSPSLELLDVNIVDIDETAVEGLSFLQLPGSGTTIRLLSDIKADRFGRGILNGFNMILSTGIEIDGDDVFLDASFYRMLGTVSGTHTGFCRGCVGRFEGSVSTTSSSAFIESSMTLVSGNFLGPNAFFNATMDGSLDVIGGVVGDGFGRFIHGSGTVNFTRASACSASSSYFEGATVETIAIHSSGTCLVPENSVSIPNFEYEGDVPSDLVARVQTPKVSLWLSLGQLCTESVYGGWRDVTFEFYGDSVTLCPTVFSSTLQNPLSRLKFVDHTSLGLPRSAFPFIVFERDVVVRRDATVSFFKFKATPDTQMFVSDQTYEEASSVGFPGLHVDAIGTTACSSGRSIQQDFSSQTSICSAAPRGTYTSGGLAVRCPAGTYSDAVGATDVSTCLPCSEGTYNPLPGKTSDGCRSCPAGRASNATGAVSAATCELCPAGTYAPLSGWVECTACAPGYVSKESGSTVCTACAPGETTEGAGSSECVECAAGRFASSSGSGGCEVCRAGTVSGQKAANCEACGEGTVSSEDGTRCVECGVGSAATGQGNYLCTVCAPGTYASTNASSECKPCARGYYASRSGTMTCDPCAAGSVASSTGSVSCDLCDEGWYSTGLAGVGCSLCPIGTYSGRRGTSVCAPCPPGTSTAAPGATSADLCEAGRSSCPSGTVEDLVLGECVALVCSDGLVDGVGGCVGCPAQYRGVPVVVPDNISLASCVSCDSDAERCPGGLPRALSTNPWPDAAGLVDFLTDASSASSSSSESGGSSASSSGYSSALTLLVVLSVSLGVVVCCGALAFFSEHTREGVRILDQFSMRHDPPVGRPLIRRRTVLGGLLSMSMIVVVLGFTIDSAVSFLEQNAIATTSLVATERAPVDEPRGAADLQFAVLAVSGGSDVTCPSATSVLRTPSSWTRAADQSLSESSGECGYVATCASCKVSQSFSIEATLPWHFQIGSIALAATGAQLPNSIADSGPTSVQARWGNVSGLSAGISALVSATSEIQIDTRTNPNPVAYGYVLTSESVQELSSTANPQTGFIPTSNPVMITVNVRPSANALITEVTERLTIVQALSLLVGAVGGITSAFAFIAKSCEGSARGIVVATKNPSLNFAEVPINSRGFSTLASKQDEQDFSGSNPLFSRHATSGPQSA